MLNKTMITNVIFVVIALEALTFLVAASLHSGAQIPFLSAVLQEPKIIPAAIVEGLCGLFLAISAYAIFAGTDWAWPAAVAAHIFSIAGVLLGMIALALGKGPTTEGNYIYHRVILVTLAAVLLMLLTPTAKSALGRM
jgi:hypothetical protein